MAAKLLNIEVGKRVVKVAVSEKKGKAYSISDCFFFATPENAVVDGQIFDITALSDVLKSELEKHIITTNNVIFSIASSKIPNREVSLPPVKKDQVKNIVATNASDYFPIDVSKYVVSSTVLEQTADECRVLVAAVPIAMVEQYIDLANLSGLTIKSIDFAGNSQYQVLKSIHGEGVDMFITVDPDFSCVTFTDNGNLLMQRSLAFGGDDVVSRYMMDKGQNDYLAALNELSIEGGAESDANVSDSLSRLVSGIARSLDYFRGSKNGDREITRVVLMGSCAHIAGLKEQICSAVGAEALLLEDVSELAGFANSIGSISTYIGCIGASVSPMDLLPKEYLAKANGSENAEKIKKNLGFVIGAFAVFLAVLLVGSSGISYLLKSRELKQLDADVMNIVDAEGKYTAYVTYQNGQIQLNDFMESTVTKHAELYAFFTELEQKMPSEIVVLSAVCTTDGITLTVTVPDFENAANVVRQLRSFESFDVLTVSPMTKSGDKSGITQVSFTVTCAYPVPVTETTTAPATEASTDID